MKPGLADIIEFGVFNEPYIVASWPQSLSESLRTLKTIRIKILK